MVRANETKWTIIIQDKIFLPYNNLKKEKVLNNKKQELTRDRVEKTNVLLAPDHNRPPPPAIYNAFRPDLHFDLGFGMY